MENGLNKRLLETPYVVSQIKRYLEDGKEIDFILRKLEDIHLIFVTPEELISFVNKHKHLKRIYSLYKKEKGVNVNKR